jgi:ubiquinone/menaquinone biosynthesis C-methylase UbiE
MGKPQNLQLADGSFEACWSEMLLEHVSDPANVIAEMVRVTKPGGRILLFEPDYSTLVIDATDRTTTKSIISGISSSVPTPWVGRTLFGLLKANGLQDVIIIPTPLMFYDLRNATKLLRLNAIAKMVVRQEPAKSQNLKRWFSDLRRRHAAGVFFACMLYFTAITRKA